MPQSGWRTCLGSEHSEHELICQFSSVQLLSCVWLFATPWTAAHQASLSITNSWSLSKLMSIVEKEIATHSSVLAWRIPGTGEPGGLPSMGSHRVGHDWSDLAAAAEAGHSMCEECVCVLKTWPLPWYFESKLSRFRLYHSPVSYGEAS